MIKENNLFKFNATYALLFTTDKRRRNGDQNARRETL